MIIFIEVNFESLKSMLGAFIDITLKEAATMKNDSEVNFSIKYCCN